MVSVEPATSQDVDAIADRWVELAEGQRAFGSHLLTGENRRRVRADIARGVIADELFVARDESEPKGPETRGSGPRESETSAWSRTPRDAVVGFVMFTVESGYYEQDARRGVVQNIYVDPDRRGEGIGSTLLTAAERALAERGAETVGLEAMADNEDARRFYRRHGYRPHRVELEKRAESDTLTKG